MECPKEIFTNSIGWVIFNPTGKHFFVGYDGNGGYYSTTALERVHVFPDKDSAVAMARRLVGKTLLVAPFHRTASAEIAKGETVVADPT